MSFALYTDRGLAREVEESQDALLGYPQAGVHVGFGVHVPMPGTWDGSGAPPPGWSSYRGSGFSERNSERCVVPIDDRVETELQEANGRLTSRQRTILQSAVVAKGDLPPDWNSEQVAMARRENP